MNALRFIVALPFRLGAIVTGALGVALVAFSLGFVVAAEWISE